MKLKTSKGKTYEVDWVDVASLTSGHLFAQLRDERPLFEIAEEFDGLEWLERKSETQGDKRFEGFNRLISISRNAVHNAVQLTFSKEG
jgi:hypothetical protein